jgi:MFS family permease
MSRDLGLLWATAFFRATATGLLGVGLGIRLSDLGYEPRTIGLVVAAGLAGAAVAALIATLSADRHGRRRTLVELALLGACGAIGVAGARHPLLVGAVAFAGMLNGMGRDRGAALIVEQAMLPGIVGDRERTRAIAVYHVFQDAGHAIGSLLAGWLGLSGFWIYAALLIATAALYTRLSAAVERSGDGLGIAISRESRSVIARISSLFALDGLAGGFLTTTLLSWWFFRRFGVGPETVGALFFGARVLNALSHLGAAWLARRIGLVNTMVWTHVPSSLLLVTAALAPRFPVAAALFLLREGLVEMDVPTRQSYVLALVRPGERTAASGITNLVRLAAWAVAPPLAGWISQSVSLAAPLLAGAAMKLGYDALLFARFRHIRPPEER